MKICKSCQEEKPPEAFHKNRAKADGLATQCKDCKALTAKRAREKNRDKDRATAKIKRERTREAQAEYKKKYRRENRPAEQARKMIHKLVKTGKIPAPSELPCEMGAMGCMGRHEYHHDSYAREDWASVRVLCASHHRVWHATHEVQA